MPVFAPDDAVVHATHGSTFIAYVSPSRGSRELCAWRLTVPPNLAGVAHRPSREEVLLVVGGSLRVTVDGESSDLATGAVVHVPAGALFRVDTGAEGGSAWVTTSVGLTATTADGAVIEPPWAR